MKNNFSFLLLFFIVFLSSSTSALAVTVDFKNTRIQKDVMHNGEKCLAVYTDASIKGNKDKKFRYQVMLLDKNGKFLNTSNKQYQTSSGSFCVTGVYTCKYDATNWTNLVLYIPNRILNSISGLHRANLWFEINGTWYECSTKPLINSQTFTNSNNSQKSNSANNVTVIFKNTRIQKDVMHNGEKCLAVYTDASIKGNKDKKFRYQVMLLDKNGKFLNTSNKQYQTSSGSFCVSGLYTCKYDATNWTNLVLYIPNRILNSISGLHRANLWFEINGTWYECTTKPLINSQNFTNSNNSQKSNLVNRPTVNFKNVWRERGVLHDGKRCVAIHTKVLVSGNKNNNMQFNIRFSDKNGNYLNTSNTQYRTKSGFLGISKDLNCKYDDTEWSNLIFYFPNNLFNSVLGLIVARIDIQINGISYSCPTKLEVSTSEEYNCYHCKGIGQYTCAYCNGNYSAPRREPSPFYPYYTLHFGNCPHCDKGIAVCGHCSGTGRLNYSHNSGNSPSYPSNNYVTQKKKHEHRIRTCDNCNGTGLKPDYSCYHTGPCTKIYCNKCGRTHCSQLKHENCRICGGAREIKEVKVDTKWVRDYGQYDDE